jgi:hypothetical protein
MARALAFAAAVAAALLLGGGDAAPVAVYILLGQSNMLGMGNVIGNTTNGTLEFAVHNESKYEYLWDTAAGAWATSDTVRNVLIMGSGNASFEQSQLLHNEFMSVVGKTIGPELGIGWTMRNFTDEPIMLLKACIGNRALGWDLLPPGSPSFDYVDPANASHITTYAGYHESPNMWEKGTTPTPIGWMAGEQYDGDTNRSHIILDNLRCVCGRRGRMRARTRTRGPCRRSSLARPPAG